MLDLPEEIISGGGPFSVYEDNQLGYQPSTRRAQEILVAVRRQFGDDGAVQVADADVLSWINDGQDTIVNRNRILKSRSFTNSIAGISQYQFPEGDIEQIESLHYNGRPLKAIPFAQAEQELRYWANAAPSHPVVWWEWAGSFTLWPTPSTSEEIVLYYTARPTRIKQLTDLLSIPDKYYQTLLQYCLQQAYELDEDWQAAEQKQSQFEANVNSFGEEERTGERMTYETITDVDGYWD